MHTQQKPGTSPQSARMALRKGVIFGCTLLLLTLAAAACSNSSQTTAAPTSTAALSSANHATLEGQVQQYSAIPTFKAPGPAFNGRAAAKGKSLFVIPASSAVPFVQTIAQNIRTVAQKLGMSFTEWDNQGLTSQWVQGMEEAISKHVTSIDLLAGVDPSLLQPQIQAAKAAGISVVVSHFYGIGQPAPSDIYNVAAPYETAGKLLADYAILQEGGRLNGLVATINQVLSTVPMMDGIRSQVQAYCPATCHLTTTNTSIADLITNLPSQTQGALERNRSINNVIALYDSAQVPYVLTGIGAASDTGKLPVETFNGTPSMLSLVKSGKVAVDVGEDLEWIAFAILDQHLRVMAGLAPVANENLPVRIWTSSNISQAGNPPANSVGYGNSFLSGYAKLWEMPVSSV